MKLLNDDYNRFCRPNCDKYSNVTDSIILVENFFGDFINAKKFFTNLDKWKCTSYQDNSKPGYESILPRWVGKSLLEKYFLDNNVIFDSASITTTCNYFYNEQTPLWSITNSNYYPHIDNVELKGDLEHICLINLNDLEVTTKFYSYKNQFQCSPEMLSEWNYHLLDIRKKLFKFYGKKDISRYEFKSFLESLPKDSDVKLAKEVSYKPNQAIIYPANLFHSPNVTDIFTFDNPRVLLRIIFNKKMTDNTKKSIQYN